MALTDGTDRRPTVGALTEPGQRSTTPIRPILALVRTVSGPSHTLWIARGPVILEVRQRKEDLDP